MSILIDKAGFAAQMYDSILSQALDEKTGDVSGARLINLLAGILIETLLVFDDPDEGLLASFQQLENMLGSDASKIILNEGDLLPSYIIDQETELGRSLARKLFEDWMDCGFEFHELCLFFIHNIIMRMEEEGQPRDISLRVFVECATRSLAYEIAAQELCDIVIERKIGLEGWSMGESITGLSAVAGRCLGLSRTPLQILATPVLQDNLDQVAYVMTQEATRLGIPAGTDWRFGLAANDCPVTAPFDLIFSLWPDCRDFFELIQMNDMVDQAVACAKAAGRMLAVAAGGDMPEIEPKFAKPLAMAAMSDTFKSVCQDAEASVIEA